MGSISGAVIMVLAGMVMLYRGIRPPRSKSSRQRVLFGLISPGAQRIVMIVLGVVSTALGGLMLYQAAFP